MTCGSRPAARRTASLAGEAEARTTRTRQTLRRVALGRSINPMVRVLVLYNTPEDPEAFDRYYEENHIPLAKRLPGLLRYTVSRKVTPLGGDVKVYLVAELDFE